MRYFRLLTSAALLALALSTASCFRRPDYKPISKQQLKGSGQVYLVPLGGFPDATVKHLASYYQNKYDLQVQTLAHVNLPPEASNPEREQLIAEAAVRIMTQAYPELSNDPQAILIGLTNQDMYIAQYDWRFSFAWREQGKYAVVSTGRMNLPWGFQPVSEDQIRARLRKMVTKNVGLLYFSLEQSDDPRSVLYRNVSGIDALDYMGEEF